MLVPPRGSTKQRGTHLAVAVVCILMVLLIASFFLVGGNSGGGGGWFGQPVPACPACPACPSRRSGSQPEDLHADSAKAEAQGEQQAAAPPPDPTLLCGGPWRVPPPDAAVAAANAAMLQGPRDDLARWSKGFTRGDLEATARRLGVTGKNDLHIWVEVKDGQLHFPRREHKQSCRDHCNYLVAPITEGLNRGIKEGKLTLQEGLPMIWNVHDWGICNDDAGRVGCPAPVFSAIRDRRLYDALLPNFLQPLAPQYVPWEEKQEVAFFRGTPFCHQHPLNGSKEDHDTLCSRHLLPLLTPQYPDLVNITINVEAQGTPAVPMGLVSYFEQAHYKYLVDLVGISASNRLAALLGINSVVLKQESREEEWYYKALKPCVHYLPFWQHNTTDILQLVEALKTNKANDETARRIAANGQAFAMAWLTEEGRWRYWQELFDHYASLYRGGTPEGPLSDPSKGVLPNNCYGCDPEAEARRVKEEEARLRKEEEEKARLKKEEEEEKARLKKEEEEEARMRKEEQAAGIRKEQGEPRKQEVQQQ